MKSIASALLVAIATATDEVKETGSSTLAHCSIKDSESRQLVDDLHNKINFEMNDLTRKANEQRNRLRSQIADLKTDTTSLITDYFYVNDDPFTIFNS